MAGAQLKTVDIYNVTVKTSCYANSYIISKINIYIISIKKIKNNIVHMLLYIIVRTFLQCGSTIAAKNQEARACDDQATKVPNT